MTLTTNEELKHLASSDNANELTRRLARECLANREAQPVKNTVLLEHSGCGYGAQIDMVTVKLNRGDVVVQIPGNIKKVINEKGEQSAVIYTAPPAPAPVIPDIGSSVVNDAAWKLHDTLTKYGPINWHQFNHLKSCLYEALKVVMTAPPALAPAVPVEIRNVYRAEGLAEVLKDAREYAPLTAEQWGTLVKNWHQTFVGLSGDTNSCRAAMPAQPVSQGCEWTYDEHDYKWDSACGEAWMFCDGGPTENGVRFCQSCGKPVLLAAAPEGGKR